MLAIATVGCATEQCIEETSIITPAEIVVEEAYVRDKDGFPHKITYPRFRPEHVDTICLRWGH